MLRGSSTAGAIVYALIGWGILVYLWTPFVVLPVILGLIALTADEGPIMRRRTQRARVRRMERNLFYSESGSTSWH